MKKIMILCLAAALLLAGCNKQESLEHESTDPAQTLGGTENPPDTTESPETLVQCFDYAHETFVSVTVTHIAKGVSVDVSANNALKAGLRSVKYDPEQKKSDAGTAEYELKINGKSLYIYAENVAAYDGSDPYPCLMFDLLSYLDGLFVGDVTSLGGYATDATVKVQNSAGGIAQVSDKSEFFTKIGMVKIIKLAHATDYTVPTVGYTIEIGEESMGICGNYLKIGADLYAVVEGDFTFLSGYTFSSSSDGFLPWI